jgi:hypothetical protein
MANYGWCISIVFFDLFFSKKAAIMHVWHDDDVIKLTDQNWACAWPAALLLDELVGHDLHLLNMKHHGVQMNLHGER